MQKVSQKSTVWQKKPEEAFCCSTTRYLGKTHWSIVPAAVGDYRFEDVVVAISGIAALPMSYCNPPVLVNFGGARKYYK